MTKEAVPVTMVAIAKVAGVTQATVSMALRDDARISLATRKRVRALAKKMGYRVDPMMAALVAYRRRLKPAGDHGKLAILNAWGETEANVPPYFARQLEGIRERAGLLGYQTELFAVPAEGAAQRSLGRMLQARGIRGVIVGPVPVERPGLFLDWRPFALAAVGHSLASPELHSAAENHMNSVETIYARLRRLGYSRIGYSNRVPAERRNRHLWLGTYLKCALLDGPAEGITPPFLFESGADQKPAEFAGWVRAHRLDAIITGYPLLVIGWLKEAGLTVPGDVAVATVVGSPGRPDPAMSGILDTGRALGRAAVDLVHGQLLAGERGVPAERRVMLIEGVWQAGATVRRRR